jgi:hypothetical protein
LCSSAGIVVVDAVDDGVGLLGGLDGLVAGHAAALVHAIGDDDDDFAAHLGFQLFAGGQVNGVVEHGAAGIANSGHGPRRNAADAGTDAQLIEPLTQQPRGAGVVLQQFGFFAEADEEGFVLLTQDLGEELGGGIALDIDQVPLAAADVHQEADGEREVGFPGEILDDLGFALFEDGEIVLLEVGDEGATLVADGGQNADHIDVHGDGGQLVGRFGLGRRLRQKGGANGKKEG